MKYRNAILLTLLFSMLSSGCSANDLKVLELPIERAAEAGVTVNRAGHPIELPLQSLTDATFVGSDGELILYADGRSLYATVVSSEDWGNPPIQMNQAPGYIFNRDFSAIEDAASRKEIEGISRMNLDEEGGRQLSTVTIKNTTIFIAFGANKSVLMLTTPDKPDQFSQLVLNGFSWDQLEKDILKGIGSM